MAATKKRRKTQGEKKYDAFKPMRDEIRRGHITYAWGRSAVPGVQTIEATHPWTPMPIGVVWFRYVGAGDTIEILNSWVWEYVRRAGVRTFLHKSLVGAMPNVKRIVTQGGTDTGLAWLVAAGFKKNEEGMFEFKVKR